MEGSSNQPFSRILKFGTINYSDYQDIEVPSSKNANVLSPEVQNLDLKASANGHENVEGGPVVSKDANNKKESHHVKPKGNDADVLRQEVQNLALKDSANGHENVEGGPVVSKDAKNKKKNHPVKPKGDNCLYFMQHGWCKFGFKCRYKHPINQSIQVPLEHHDAPVDTTAEWSQPIGAALPMKTLSADARAYQQQTYQPRVVDNESPKPYVQPRRTLKFDYEFQPPRTSLCPLNDKGLPLRPDMEVCRFYSRYGICKKGPACRFNHPATLRWAVPAAGSEEAQVVAAGSQETHVPPDGSKGAQVPPAETQKAQLWIQRSSGSSG